MAEKFIKLSSGVHTETEAITTSAGAGDSGKLAGLDGSGRFDSSMMPVGVGADTKTVEASENLSAGDLVNIHNATGEKVRKGDASNGYEAHGFVLSAVTSGQNATVYCEGTITGLSSLTPGARQYLSATAGVITETPVTTSTYIHQYVGVAVSDTEISFEPGDKITLA